MEILSGKTEYNSRKGISFVEMVIYIGILSGLAVLMTNFLIHIVQTYQRAHVEREVISNGRLMLETISRVTGEAREVYSPTSRFNTDAGQLSLVTPVSSDVNHSTHYIDIWVDNGRLWMREEGSSSIPLSSPSVRVVRFYMERIIQAYRRESVKFILQVDAVPSRFPSSTTLNFSVSLRGDY